MLFTNAAHSVGKSFRSKNKRSRLYVPLLNAATSSFVHCEASGSPAEVATAFREAYRMLERRIRAFVSLPVHGLDQLSLQSKLREIGRMGAATAKVAEPN